MQYEAKIRKSGSMRHPKTPFDDITPERKKKMNEETEKVERKPYLMILENCGKAAIIDVHGEMCGSGMIKIQRPYQDVKNELKGGQYEPGFGYKVYLTFNEIYEFVQKNWQFLEFRDKQKMQMVLNNGGY
jgi:hypothetical protein